MCAGYNESMIDPVTLIHHLSRRAIEADEAQTLLDEMNRAAMEAVGADRAFVALAHGRHRRTHPGLHGRHRLDR